jgi:lysophospholipase L1-like esterase
MGVVLVLALLMSSTAFAVTRVLLVGDSWTQCMWDNKNLRDDWASRGFSTVIEDGDTTAIGGTTAAWWAQSANLALITAELNANANLDIVHLSMGGNDFLAGQSAGGWYKGMGSTAEENLMDAIKANIDTVIQHILSVRPTASIVICSYDYINLWDTLGIQANQLMWANLGQPSPRELNDALRKLGDHQRQLGVSYGDDVTYVNNWGQMHEWTGYNYVFAAGQYAAPWGHPSYPWERACGANNGDDAIHLSDAGYDKIADRCWTSFYYYMIDPNAPALPSTIDNDYAAPPPATYTQLFYDGFENSVWSYANWFQLNGVTFKSLNTYWGTWSLEMDSTDSALKARSTVGYENIRVTLWLKTAGYDAVPQDKFYVEYTTNYGANWVVLQTFTGNRDWTFCEYLMPAAAENNAYFGVRLRAGTNSSSDDAWVDEFKIEGN